MNEEKPEEVKVQSIQFPDETGGLTLQAKHPAFAVLAAQCVKMFKESGGVNYVEWRLSSDDPGFGIFTVVIQRDQGKTPAQRVSELQNQIVKYEKMVAIIKDGIKRYERGNGNGWWALEIPQEKLIDLFEVLVSIK